MGNRRKKRYQTKGNIYPPLVVTGRCFLVLWEESYLNSLEKGDVRFLMGSDTSRRNADEPGYEFIGGAGYLKAMVYDGRDWQFLVMDDIFTEKQHCFNKKERPLDTYSVCHELISSMGGVNLYRTYRRHYKLKPDLDESVEEAESEQG